jgi:septum formation protein
VTALILASASASRQRMLLAAGISFQAVPAPVDEAAIKQSMRAQRASAHQIAEVLAELKAVRISERFPDALVLGADQTLELGHEILDKPGSLEDAAGQLRRLSGGIHALPTAAVMAEHGAPVWRKIVSPKVTFRPLSEAFIAAYLGQMGERALNCVGGCEVEGLGAQMITKIEGDFFAILGLPLLDVLDYLRLRGIMPS